MKFFLRDINPKMTEAWKTWFADLSDVEISTGDIFEGPKADAIVSPANSFGEMSGGIDLNYSIKFGWGVQERIQKLLKEEHDGELPVGQAVIVPTEHEDWPWCVSAPTMRIPMFVHNTPNAYLAFRAVIREVNEWNADLQKPEHKIESILCPGLGTAVGRMPFDVCAKQMFYAYMVNYKKEPEKIHSLNDAVTMHTYLTTTDKKDKVMSWI